MDTFVDPKDVQKDAVRNIESAGTEDSHEGETDVESLYEFGSEEDDCWSYLGSDDEQLVGSLFIVERDMETDGDDEEFCDTVILGGVNSHTVATIGMEFEHNCDVHMENSGCFSNKQSSVLLVLLTAAMNIAVKCCNYYVSIVDCTLESMMLKTCKIVRAIVCVGQSLGRRISKALMKRCWTGTTAIKRWLAVPRYVPSAVELLFLCTLLVTSAPMLREDKILNCFVDVNFLMSEGHEEVVELHTYQACSMTYTPMVHVTKCSMLQDPRQTFDLMLQATRGCR